MSSRMDTIDLSLFSCDKSTNKNFPRSGEGSYIAVVGCVRVFLSKKLDRQDDAARLDIGPKLQLYRSVEILFYSLAVLVLVHRTL
jgi:hypothetical protein